MEAYYLPQNKNIKKVITTYIKSQLRVIKLEF